MSSATWPIPTDHDWWLNVFIVMILYVNASVLSQSCAFVKKRDDSVLRIVWNGGLRFRQTVSSGGSCRRWFFTINGLECSEPKAIDTRLYINTNIVNMHKPAYGEITFKHPLVYFLNNAIQSQHIKLHFIIPMLVSLPTGCCKDHVCSFIWNSLHRPKWLRASVYHHYSIFGFKCVHRGYFIEA